MKYVTATFATRTAADAALADLEGAGFTQAGMSLMMTGPTRKTWFVPGDKAGEGAAVGGALGAIGGSLAALAVAAVPGGVFVAGPFGAAVAGALAGGAGGGLLGALVGAGMPEEHARLYHERVRSGEAVIGVDTATDAQARKAAAILTRHGATTPPAVLDRNPVPA